MRTIIFTAMLALFVSTSALAQTPPKNPTVIAFTSTDHDNPATTGYEVDIVTTAGTVSQTINVLKSATMKLPTGEISVTLNVQPVAFGSYTFKVRTVAGAIKSTDSLPSETWDRSPGAPGRPTIPR